MDLVAAWNQLRIFADFTLIFGILIASLSRALVHWLSTTAGGDRDTNWDDIIIAAYQHTGPGSDRGMFPVLLPSHGSDICPGEHDVGP